MTEQEREALEKALAENRSQGFFVAPAPNVTFIATDTFRRLLAAGFVNPDGSLTDKGRETLPHT